MCCRLDPSYMLPYSGRLWIVGLGNESMTGAWQLAREHAYVPTCIGQFCTRAYIPWTNSECVAYK